MNPAFWRGRRVFVTGHTGFKGSWLCLWLARAGAEVVGYSNGVPTHPSLYEAARVEETLTSILGDVRDREALSLSIASHRPELVFHLAAQPLVRRSFVEPELTYETNVIGTMNVLAAVKDVEGIRAVIIVTTDKVYESQGSGGHREEDTLGGRDPYSSSKACAEILTSAYRSSYFGTDSAPSVATVRAGNVIGGGDWAPDRLVPDLVAALTEEAPIEIRYPEYVRPWQHVLNPLEGYLMLSEQLWENRSFARAWNFGPDPSDSRTVEWIAAGLAERWGSALRVGSSTRAQAPEAATLEIDSSRARAELGWEPRWGIDRGLDATAEWYRRYAEGADARALTETQLEAFELTPRGALTAP